MGTRLVIFIVMGFLIPSCATKRFSEVGSTEKEFVIAFKKSVLMGCLNEVTDNEFGKFLVTKHNDIGLYTEVAILYHSEVQLAKEMGGNYAKTLKPVDYPDVTGKKQGYSNCIDYAFYSKEIDSIAKSNYKKMKKGKMNYIYEN